MKLLQINPFILLLLLNFQTLAASDGKFSVKLLYFEREPLYVQSSKLGEAPSGIVIDVVNQILKNFNHNVSFSNMPPKRQLNDLLDKNNHCGIGWFKNNLREEAYKFSYPIFFDGEMYLLGNKSQKESNFKSISEILENKKTKILIKSEFSYGEVLDKLFKDATNVESLNNKQMSIIGMVDRSRGHFTIVSREEKNYIESSNEYKNIYFVKLNGVSNFSARYLMCSKNINLNLFEDLNTAILKYYGNQKLELVNDTK